MIVQHRQTSTTNGCTDCGLQFRETAEIIYNVVQGNRTPLSTIKIAKDGLILEALARDCRHKVGSGTPKRATKKPKTKTASKDAPSGNAAVAQEPGAVAVAKLQLAGLDLQILQSSVCCFYVFMLSFKASR